jgi:non-ribosomal peptide synthetase component F
MRSHLETLLKGAVENPAACLSELPLLTREERETMLWRWNRTGRDYPLEEPVHRLFELQVDRSPAAIAVQCGTSRWSFRQLDRRADSLARRLRALGVGAEAVVGVYLDRSPELLAALLAVWKAGGAYLALDPAHPVDRLCFQLQDAGAGVLIVGDRLAAELTAAVPHLLVLAELEEETSDGTDCLDHEVTADQLAYVLYTSGSTGRPKGVLVPHRGVVNYLTWCIEHYRIAAGEGMPVHTSVAFDLTVTSLFAPLLAGRPAILLPAQRGVGTLVRALVEQPG